MRWVVDGWPEKHILAQTQSNCLLWGHRVVIPEPSRKIVLHELHFSHFGISKMKALAREFVWWPSLDSDLEELTRSCDKFLESKKMPVKIPLTPWSWPIMPWHRVHADFLGPLANKYILLLYDSHSKWPEAFIMPNMGEDATIATFQEIFT